MRIPKLRYVVIGAAALGLVAAGLVGAGAIGHRSDPVIATADGSPIALSQARTRLQGLNAVGHDVTKTFGPNWRDMIVQSLVDDVIVREQAVKMGITVTGDDLQKNLATVRQGMTPGQYAQWLASQKMTEQDLLARIRLQLLGARVYLAVTASIHATDAEVADYYRKHPADFKDASGNLLPLDQVSSKIRDDLEKPRKDAAYSAWLKARRAEVKVVVLRKDWS